MKKILIFSFLTAAIFGIIKIISIAPFDRMSADDFTYTTLAFAHGILKAQVLWYTSAFGTFINNFLVTIFGVMSSGNGSTFLYFLMTVGLLFAGTFVFFNKITKSKLGLFYSILVSLLFIASYYLITPNKNESWYWLAGSVEYLWPTIFILIGFGFVFEKKLSNSSRILLFVLAFLVSGISEVAATLLLFTSFVSLVYLLVRKDKLFANLIPVFIATLTGFLIMYFSPGNAIRIKSPGSNEMSIIGSILYSIQKGPELYWTIIRNNYVFLFSLLISLSAFFSFFDIEFTSASNNEKLYSRIFCIIIFPIFLSIIYMLPGYRALGRVPPDRAEIELSFLILLSLAFASLYLSRIFKEHRSMTSNIYGPIIFLAVLTFFVSSFMAFTKTIAEDIYIAKNYSDSFDVMFAQLKAASLKNKNKIVIVKPLPESGLIHSEVLTSDPGHWANTYISGFFGLKGIKTEEISTNVTN